MRRLLIVISIVLCASMASAWTTTMDFESSIGFSEYGNVTLSTAEKSSGSQSARFTFDTGDDVVGYARYTFPAPLAEGTEIWIRYYLKFASNWQWSNTYVKFMRLLSTDGHMGFGGGFGNSLYISNEVHEPNPEFLASGSVTPGQWQCLEIYYKISSTAPVIRSWINGELQVNTTAYRTFDANTFSLAEWFYIWNSPYPPQLQYAYVDDVVITNEQPTARDSSGYYMIGPGSYTPPADTTAPTISSMSVSTSGTQLVVNFSEAVTGYSGITVSPSGGAATISYASGVGSSTIYYTLSRTIAYGETITAAYTKPVSNFIEDLAGNDLASPQSGISVTNYVPAPGGSAPVISNLSPSGLLSCTTDPQPITFGATTDVAATCRGSLTNTTYDLMGAGANFDTTGGTSHSSVGLPGIACGQTFTLYVQCRDGSGNTTTTPGLISASVDSASATAMSGPLRVSQNPRYFTDDSGRAIYLTGSHTWGSLQDYALTDPPPAFDFDTFLDFLTENNHNYTRMWVIAVPLEDAGGGEPFYATPFPWNRTGPGTATDGKDKFDLTSFNTAYFDRLRARVSAAKDAGIYVSLMLFEGWGMQYARHANDGFPLQAANNINSIDAGATTEALTLDDAAVTAIQEAYVKKVIDTVQDLDNVLYEIANEAGGASTAWQEYMIALIKAYEISEGYDAHPVGFTYQNGPSPGTNATLFASDADWISPGADDTDGYDYITNIRPADGSKVILLDTDHLWGVGGDSDWIFKSFMRGQNPIYMDCYDSVQAFCPESYETTRQAARTALGYTRQYAERINLVTMSPQGALASTGYALANPGYEYLIYQPSTGAFSVYLTGVDNTFNVEWFDPSTGVISTGTQITGGATRTMTPPFSGPAVLYLLPPGQAGPVILSTSPSGSQTYAAGEQEISAVTDKAVTCRWGTLSLSDYYSYSNVMAGGGTTAHTATLTGLSEGTTYTRYGRCIDAAGNQSTTFSWSWSYPASGGGLSPATLRGKFSGGYFK